MNGVLRHCGPLSPLLGGCLVVMGAVFVHTLPAAVCAVFLAAVLLAVLMGNDRFPTLRLVPGVIASVAVTGTNWFLSADHHLGEALVVGLRMAVLVIPTMILASYIDIHALGEHLSGRLAAPSRPTLALVAAMQRVETMGTDLARVRQIRRIRGLGPGSGPLTWLRSLPPTVFALIVQALRQASRMSIAMEVRGFSAPQSRGGRRTWGQEAVWTSADTIVVSAMACVALVPIVVQALI